MQQLSETTNEKQKFKRLPHNIYESICCGSPSTYQFAGKEITKAAVYELMDRKAYYISLAEVPSALAMRSRIDRVLLKNVETVRSDGFRLKAWSIDKVKWVPIEPSAIGSVIMENDNTTRLSELLQRNATVYNESVEVTDELNAESKDFTLDDEDIRRNTLRINSDDPFLVHAALELMKRKNPNEILPKVFCWAGGSTRLCDRIPVNILKSSGCSKVSKNAVDFVSLADVDAKLVILLNHTYWGKVIKQTIHLTSSFKDKTTIPFELRWQLDLWENIKTFLRGDDISTDSENTRRKERSSRFLQMLRTIDGVFYQKYLAYPDMVWNWEKYDLFNLGMISILLPDEFLDIPQEEEPRKVTAFEKLKEMRKKMKDYINRNDLQSLLSEIENKKDPLSRIFLPELLRLNSENEIQYKLLVAGILSQTRGCGTPPPLVALRAKKKFLITVSKTPEKLDSNTRSVLIRSINELLNDIPNEALTGLHTKAGVRVNTNACYEKNRAEGGTAKAINDIVYEASLGRKCLIIDLNTGKPLERKFLNEVTNGEYIFWRCLEDALKTPPDQLRTAGIVGAQEPGKTRVVTKSNVKVKIVLDLVHAVCAWPLTKIDSSTSGMKKENHGWNFFKEFFNNPEMVFNLIDREEKKEGTDTYVTDTFEDLYCSSTDYSTATDYMEHEIGSLFGEMWMRKCGIPPILRGFVHNICFKPRKLQFKATGFLKKYGYIIDEENHINEIMMVRGVMMGDPLTKILLHMSNIVTRYTSIRLNKLYDVLEFPLE